MRKLFFISLVLLHVSGHAGTFSSTWNRYVFIGIYERMLYPLPQTQAHAIGGGIMIQRISCTEVKYHQFTMNYGFETNYESAGFQYRKSIFKPHLTGLANHGFISLQFNYIKIPGLSGMHLTPDLGWSLVPHRKKTPYISLDMAAGYNYLLKGFDPSPTHRLCLNVRLTIGIVANNRR
mgnify:CR=1 FL=1